MSTARLRVVFVSVIVALSLSTAYGGHWAHATDPQSKNQAVDSAWDILVQRGVQDRVLKFAFV